MANTIFEFGTFIILNQEIKLNLVIESDDRWIRAKIPVPHNYPETKMKISPCNIFEMVMTIQNYRDFSKYHKIPKEFENYNIWIYVREFNVIPKLLNVETSIEEMEMLKNMGKKCFNLVLEYLKVAFLDSLNTTMIYLHSEGGSRLKRETESEKYYLQNNDIDHVFLRSQLIEKYPLCMENHIEKLGSESKFNFEFLLKLLLEIENNLTLTKYYIDNFGFVMLFGEKSHGFYTELILPLNHCFE